jgi:hypothetical protein
MSDKQEVDYTDLIRRLEIKPEEFFMIGNSLSPIFCPFWLSEDMQSIFLTPLGLMKGLITK